MKTNKKSAPTKKRLRKQPKKIVAKKNQNSNMALATVSYADIISPITHDSSLSLVKSYFPEKVIKFIIQPTPRKFIQQRPGPGGKQFDYVSGWYAKKCANYAFGFNHSFEIKSKEICGTSAIVEGRFIVTDPKTGKEIFHKDDIGGHKIRFIIGKASTAENAVDVANDYKSAATDALKRCMAQIGFFMDVYGVGEAKDDGNYTNGRPQEDFVEGSNIHVAEIKPVSKTNEVTVEYECESCAEGISQAEAEYSKKIFKRRLCRNCQKAKR
jgi:hypothetical protein